MGIALSVSERSGPQATTRSLSVGCLIFAQMDQIDFTGPFEVLSRMSDTTVHVVGKELAPVRDMQGLRLIPDARIADAGIFDVLHVPGGYGQQALMHDQEVLGLIRTHVQMEKLLFSVCTGALLCGAAGVLAGRQVTTHWSARHLMPHYGADLRDSRVVVDGNIISAASVTAGLDAALVLVSLLRGDAAAQEIHLPLSMHRTRFSIAAPQRPRRMKCCRAFRQSTSRSGQQGRQRRLAMQQKKHAHPYTNPAS